MEKASLLAFNKKLCSYIYIYVLAAILLSLKIHKIFALQLRTSPLTRLKRLASCKITVILKKTLVSFDKGSWYLYKIFIWSADSFGCIFNRSSKQKGTFSLNCILSRKRRWNKIFALKTLWKKYHLLRRQSRPAKKVDFNFISKTASVELGSFFLQERRTLQ